MDIPTPTLIDDFDWINVSAGGVTDMGKGLQLLASELSTTLPENSLGPVIALVTDGYPTDDIRAGLSALFSEPWGKRAVRIAIAIGSDAGLDVLASYIDDDEMQPLLAFNPAELASYIHYASTTVVEFASGPTIHISDIDARHTLQPPATPFSSNPVW